MRTVFCSLVVAFLGIAFLLPAVGQAQPPENECGRTKHQSLSSLVIHKQETVAWCWAASAQMVMQFLTPQVIRDQCFIVDAVRQNQLGLEEPPSCCVRNSNTAVGCPISGDPAWALSEFNFISNMDVIANVDDPNIFGWTELTAQICGKQPIIYGESYIDGGGHTYVIRGFKEDPDGEPVIEIYNHDPDLVDSPNHTDFAERPYSFIRLPSSGVDPDGRQAVSYYKDIQFVGP